MRTVSRFKLTHQSFDLGHVFLVFLLVHHLSQFHDGFPNLFRQVPILLVFFFKVGIEFLRKNGEVYHQFEILRIAVEMHMACTSIACTSSSVFACCPLNLILSRAGGGATIFAFFLVGSCLPFAGALRFEAGVELEALDEGALEEKPFKPSDVRSFSFSAMIFRRSCSLRYR
jgi:hypothetical protein